MKKHTVQANGDVLATAVEKRMLELGMYFYIFSYENIIYLALFSIDVERYRCIKCKIR